MSDFHLKGVLDRFGGIDWILIRHGGLAQPIAVFCDFEMTQLKAEMDEQRADLEAFQLKKSRKSKARKE